MATVSTQSPTQVQRHEPATAELFKALPAISRVLAAETLEATVAEVGEGVVKDCARALLGALREQLAAGDEAAAARVRHQDFFQQFCQSIDRQARAEAGGSLRPVINLTGTVLHTNLGRAKLAPQAIAAMQRAAGEPCNLEYDLNAGKRGDRDAHVEGLLCALTGAEAATVVNNNAAAVVLVLNTFSQNKETLISRGELVEIGGSFRIPDVMRSASAILREVGTTNRTHLKDFSEAMGEATGLIMKVHTSNYAIQGFTASVPDAELSELARAHAIPYVSDLGSGTLIDLRRFGLPHEPTVKETLEGGADLVTFSGDKLLGGPQCGVVAGRRDLVALVKKNPLKRALRVDKLTLAALHETLALYRDPERLKRHLPLFADLTREPADIRATAESVLPFLRKALGRRATVTIEDCQSQIGSGALPVDLLPSSALVIAPTDTDGGHDAALMRLVVAFRNLSKPVIGRVHDGRLYLDVRCLQDQDEFIAQLSGLRY